MAARILAPEEWGRVDGLDISALLPFFKPENVHLVVVEKEGEVVATWAAMRQVTFEGLWVHPEHRRGKVIPQLLRTTFDAAKPWANSYGVTWSKDEAVSRQIRKLGGQRFDAETFFLATGGA